MDSLNSSNSEPIMDTKNDLTDEQKERTRRNREMALERRKKALEHQQMQMGMKERVNDKEEHVQLEDFEVDASSYVTAAEAMKKYCLPQGTLDVCEYIEKDNPRNAKFSKMKLYLRSEIRRRARDRFGGLEGLQEERRKREMKRFQKDFEDVNNVFKKSKP